MKIVVRRPAGTTVRVRGAQVTAAFFLGLATYALILANVGLFAVFAVVAALAAAWDMGWRVFIREDSPE